MNHRNLFERNVVVFMNYLFSVITYGNYMVSCLKAGFFNIHNRLITINTTSINFSSMYMGNKGGVLPSISGCLFCSYPSRIGEPVVTVNEVEAFLFGNSLSAIGVYMSLKCGW